VDGPVWTIRTLLVWAKGWLEKKGIESPRLDAELLLSHALQLPRIKLYAEFDKPLTPAELAKFKALLLRRADREPVAYVLGFREFYGRPFFVDKHVFIPRPETELLVQGALQHLDRLLEGAAGLRALDLCAGSGAVGLSLAAERQQLAVDLVELSPETAAVTRKNAAALVPNRPDVRVLEGDLFAPLVPGARYEVICSNPPYIPTGDRGELAPEILRHEPHLALFGGQSGLEVVARIVAEAPRWLTPGGALLVELDPSGAERAKELAVSAGLVQARIEKDLSGLDRILIAHAPL
jgi:release factor glutamine methyltransferase